MINDNSVHLHSNHQSETRSQLMNISNLKLSKLNPERFFLVFAAFFGLIFILVTPPFQSPDEICHFYKAYQISEGTFISKQHDKRVGGYIPESIVSTADSTVRMFGNAHQKANSKDLNDGLTVPLNPAKKIFVDFPNSAIYSPISYAPQAFMIGVLRAAHLPPLYLLYGARLASLAFWIFCVFLTIRMMPFHKWLFVLLALLPMSIFSNMSVSADVVTNGLSFLVIGYFLRLIFSVPKITKKHIWIALGLTILLTSAKFVYAPLILLLLLIPIAKFASKKTFFLQIGSIFFVALITALVWSSVMGSFYLTYDEYNPLYRGGTNIIQCADIQGQLHYILHHGTYIFSVFYDSLIHSFDMYYQGYIGTFGWLDTKLPSWLIASAYLVIFLVAILDSTKKIVLSWRHKLIFGSAFILLILLILVTQHLAWDCVGGSIISNLQGRYFIPVFPLLFMLFYTHKINLQRLLIPLVVLFSLGSLSISTKVIYERYYVPTEYDALIIKHGGEHMHNDGVFETSEPSILVMGGTQSTEIYRSGEASILLTPDSPYGCIYRIYDSKIGDRIHIEGWCKSKGGGPEVVIDVQPIGLHIIEEKPSITDENGWQKLSRGYTITEDMTGQEIAIYLYNSSKIDTIYFDDVIISYNKIK
ncbi:MAG: putative membrane protein [Crocinitomicaceae bacterium]|jgi:uncharacterized membrane protein